MISTQVLIHIPKPKTRQTPDQLLSRHIDSWSWWRERESSQNTAEQSKKDSLYRLPDATLALFSQNTFLFSPPREE